MPSSPTYTKVPSEDSAGQETEFEEIHSGSVSKTTLSEEAASSMVQGPVQKVEVLTRTASANEVRAYIFHLLANKHNTTTTIAHEVANKWTLGRGYDFLDASANEFSEIFDAEFGNHLYKSAAEDEWVQWNTQDVQITFIILQSIAYVAAFGCLIAVLDSKTWFRAIGPCASLATVLPLPKYIFRPNAPVHVRDRYQTGIHDMWPATALWVVYIALQLRRG